MRRIHRLEGCKGIAPRPSRSWEVRMQRPAQRLEHLLERLRVCEGTAKMTGDACGGRRDGACPNIGPPDARHCRASACERVEELSVVYESIVVRVHLLHHLFDVLWNERQVPHAERAHDLIHIDEAAVVVVHVPDEEWESEHHRNVSSDVSSLLSQSTHRKVTGRGSLYALEAAIEHLLHRRQSEAIRAHQRTERQLACS